MNEPLAADGGVTDGQEVSHDYVDIREIHPDWREAECWHCGNTWLERRPEKVCHGCFMGQQKVDEEHRGDSTVNGYTDYGELWYGEVDDRSEYADLYEESTAEVRERLKRSRTRDREVKI